ncbi:ABC transporter permease [Cryobacterium sp. TMT1-66-1]|uniref:ABC transporter permease n=1 Tax=Cryobacterium sp. TMT1-66-1 TaxID=1259242 RepID=UPI001068E94A|nr:ABC transporter permease [Cryobacterium sp. TMT1-66-1]TFD10319.1 ABC transporter permease [Cryobacterium sp. TMT1-66-1]
MKHLNGPALGVTGILLFLVAWEAIPRLGLVNERYLPPASLVMAKFFAYLVQPGFWSDVAETMTAWALGLAIAIITAIVLGLFIGSSLFLRRATRSTIEFLRPIPSVALIPLAVLLFGLKIESSLLLIVYASFWQVLLQVLSGVADVDPVADNTARSYGLGRMARIRYVVWPTTLPYLMTGIRLASAVALILAITAELVIGSPGLGQQIALTQSGGAVAEMYALIVATGLIGVLINAGVRLVEKRVLSWHTSVRGEVAL